jgi:hypothetical protein
MMEKHIVIPEEDFKALQHVSRQGKGLPPQKSEYERLVELNTSLQNQLKQQHQAKPPAIAAKKSQFPDSQQRIWDLLTAYFPGLGFNKSWEIVNNGDTWGGSNVFDLLKAACDENFPAPTHMPQLVELIKEARIPQSLLALQQQQNSLSSQPMKKKKRHQFLEDLEPANYKEESMDDALLEKHPPIGYVETHEELSGRPSNRKSSRPARITRPPNRYEPLHIGRKLGRYEAYK